MPKFNKPSVVLTLAEWDQVLADREELARLRELRKSHEEFQDEYLKWSLSGGMAKAVLAGIEMGREERRKDDDKGG